MTIGRPSFTPGKRDACICGFDSSNFNPFNSLLRGAPCLLYDLYTPVNSFYRVGSKGTCLTTMSTTGNGGTVVNP